MLNDKMGCEARRAQALVLVVDDDPTMRLLIGESLQQAGFAIEEAEDGLSALTAFERLQPDIVMLDVNMPGMDGFTVCTELRRMPVGNGVPVLMVTGLDDEASINRAYEAGATDFITKPINWPVLGHRVRYVLRASQALDDLRRTEQALRKSEEQFRQLAENIPQVFWITNAEQDQGIYISPAYEKIWGRTLESLGANPDSWRESIHPDDYTRVFAALKKAPLGEYLEEYRIVRPDGTVRWVHDRAFPVANEQGQVYRIAGIVEDITDRKEAEQRLLHLAHYDSLTNLPNRVLFRDRLTQTIARANRNKQIVALIFIDLDRFKEINDTLGHDTGDCLLTGVATRLKNTLRQADTLARLGGDEFTLIVEDLYHETEYENIVITIAQKILESFSSPFSVGGKELFVTPSIGITLYPFDADDVDSLLKCADVAMYHAKALGRNNYQFYAAEMNAMAPERLKVEHNLRRALEREEFRLHYQPKVNLITGEICGVEALLRWQRPDHGLVSSAGFIPLLEETGLILPVGEWVLRAALTQIKSWQMAGVTPVPIAINFSARQFQQKDLERMVRRALDEVKIDPMLLELEITESSLMKNEKQAIRTLLNLKSLGIHLSIDDFGTGYSSLSYLKRFPVDTLKIDQSFVKDITTDTDDALITRTIITMAHNLKLKAVAEGVESEGQLTFLRSLNCDYGQGYYFSRPLPAHDCTELLKEKRQLLPAKGIGLETHTLRLVSA
jgi:diguanylate cyclase (GGDEF)-like protein/PAS domain S-box-containing protein